MLIGTIASAVDSITFPVMAIFMGRLFEVEIYFYCFLKCVVNYMTCKAQTNIQIVGCFNTKTGN